jgi:hypothetical protein
MGLWTSSQRAMKELVDRLRDISTKKAVNALQLRKSGFFVYFRANKDGSVDVTPTIRLKNLSVEEGETFIRALDNLYSDPARKELEHEAER